MFGGGKFLYIIIAIILCVSLVNSITYVQSFNLIENTFTGLYDAVDRVSGLFGVFSDRIEKLLFLYPSSLGVLELETQNVDISNYISEHLLPPWLKDISNEYSVSVYASPVSYNIVANTGPRNNFDIYGFVSFNSKHCIRLKIVISGNGYHSEHNLLVALGNYHFSRNNSDTVYGLYYFSFDVGTSYFDVGVNYSSFENFLSDSNNVSAILDGFPPQQIGFPINHIYYTENSTPLSEIFLDYYNYLERE